MTMNVQEILGNTLSPVAQLREDATLALDRLARESFPNYLVLLCQELANDSCQPHIRQAAGIGLKNAFTAKDSARHDEYVGRWSNVDSSTKENIKNAVIQALGSIDPSTGTVAGQVIAAIAAIELPLGQWGDLINTLLNQVTHAQTAMLKQMTLQAIGFVCETLDPHVLSSQSNAILNAVAQGVSKEEEYVLIGNSRIGVRLAAIQALQNSLEFIRENFEREAERNYIMQIVCEATQMENTDIQVSAYECLCKIMSLFYDKMEFYMSKALYGITIMGMRHESDRVVLQAVEFWSTVCEIEYDILLEQQEAAEIHEPCNRVYHQFALKATKDLCPPLLWLLSVKEDEEDEDEWNVSMAAATCLNSLATCVADTVVPQVLPFIEGNIRQEDWRKRDAAVMAFGSILDGPQPTSLQPLVTSALPLLIQLTRDPSIHVRDSAAWTLGRICELLSSYLTQDQLHSLIVAILPGLGETPRVASNCAWCFINLAEQLAAEDHEQTTNALSGYFEHIMQALNTAGEQPIQDPNFRASAYEAIATLTTNAPKDCINVVNNLTILVLERLEQSVAVQSQLVGGDDVRFHHEMQANLCNVLTSIIRKLGKSVLELTDRIMNCLLMVLSSASKGSTVMEDSFLVIGAVTVVSEAGFSRYVESFKPFLIAAIQNHEEHQLCSIAIGLVGDISRALNDGVAPYCDEIMTYLLQHLQNPSVHRTIKPAVLSCFGDIALAISGHFEAYLQATMTALFQVHGGISGVEPSTLELEDLYYQLKEGILEAFIGIIQGLKTGQKAPLLTPYVQHMFAFGEEMASDLNRPETLTRCLVGMIGDLADAFPPGHLKPMFSVPWIDYFLKEVKSDRSLSVNTKEVGKWSREMVRRQISV